MLDYLRNQFSNQARSNVYFLFFTLLLVVELGLFTFLRPLFGLNTLPFLFLGCQLTIGILPLFLFKKRENGLENAAETPQNVPFLPINFLKTVNFRKVGPLSILVILGVFATAIILLGSYSSMPISIKNSDIIPQIQVLCNKFLTGEYPYKPFDDFGYPMTPTYLPAHWMPYLPAQILKFDPRFITLAIFIVAFLFFSVHIFRQSFNTLTNFLLLSLPVLFISAVHDHDMPIWSISVELMIVSYYLLLGLSLTINSKILQSVTLILCLMSRFSLVFWLPLYVFMLWTKEGWKPTLRLCLGVLAGCSLLYAPFLWKNPHIFFDALAYYDTASIAEWSRNGSNGHLQNGLGFASFYHAKGGELSAQIADLKKTMLILTPSVSVVLGLIWYKFKDKLDFSLFAICALKISLAVFYIFVQIPYAYLYVTPVILSLIVLYRSAYLIKNGQLNDTFLRPLLANPVSLMLVIAVCYFLFTETLSGTYGLQEIKNSYTNSINYVISGVLLAFLPLFRIKIHTPTLPKPFSTALKWTPIFIGIFIVLCCIPLANNYLLEVPINYKNADMIPILKIQAQRFLKGEDVYALIPEIWGGMKPIYLSFLWLPFTISEYFGFDARWIVLGGIAVGLFFLFKIFQQSKILLPSVMSLVGLFYILNFFVLYDKPTIIYAEEGVIVGYYLFLGYAISRKNAWLIGLAIGFCVLSRYLLVFWLPVFWLYWFFCHSRREAWIILSVSLGLFLGTFLMPYGFENLKLLTGQHEAYIAMAKRNWLGDPEFTLKNLGFAKFFTVDIIETLHKYLISTAIGAPLFMGILFLIVRSKKWFQPQMFALCSLKLTMVCFYNLLEMPYMYLFYTNTFFSYCLVYHYFTLVEKPVEPA